VKPNYVYVATSWRNPMQPAVVATLRSAGIDCYDFRSDEGAGFRWQDVGEVFDGCSVEDYLQGLDHPRAQEGFLNDFRAMQRADAFVLLLPCGRSAHLELGWAVGMGAHTAILLEPDNVVPELMYKMVDHIATTMVDLLGWLGVEDG
jgi:hypothetical protein